MTSRMALAALAWATAGTAAPAAERELLRWPDVVARVEQHPRVREARARADGAAASVRAVGQVPNPRLEATAGTARSHDGALQRTEWALSLSVPLDWLGTRGARVDAARAAADAAREEDSNARREVLLQARRLFVTLAYDQELAASHEASLAQVGELARVIARRVEQGEGRPTELPRIEIEVQRARAALEQAVARRQVHRDQLSILVGERFERVAADLAAAPEPPSPAELESAMRDRHPLLMAGRARVSSARSEVVAERRQRIPAITPTGYALSELDRVAVGGGLGIELPVWNWNSGRVAQAEAGEQVEESRLLATTRDLAASLAEAVGTCAQSRSLALRFREAILPRAEASARTAERSFRLGEATLIEVLDAHRVLLESRRDALAAALDQQLDCGTLTIVARGELP